ncbi:protein LOW PSII ACCUMULATION 1, chloroplastic isoform X2 [Asparagus officinalis]|uniref:protein LOW PSII ACCUMULATION 1, chloroplastic isoform X2 n=1 Tax=Asparagus officinalis TaxID=4686 RepID=UPI00098E8254|nr:protein LOW PSII ACCUMULATION 1, chloroplastic isoform X2 [Asparagus officinalis]
MAALSPPQISFLVPSFPNPNSIRTHKIPPFSPKSKKGAAFSPRTVRCSAANKPSPSAEVSSTAKIRSEVLSPFRSVRMFFYLAFIASAGLGGLITTPRLISALANSSRSSELPEVLNSLGIDLGAVLIFAFLYSRENNAKNAQVSRLLREERLSKLKLSKPFTEGLIERGILVVPFATDGENSVFEFEESDEEGVIAERKKRLWQLTPIYTSEWANWIDEQKKLAKVSSDSPVYLSLRLDGRVRGSGVGYPPWNAFVAQLPPVKGIWSGLLDGMDGRVL